MIPSHSSVWIQLLDHSQQHLKLMFIPLPSFIEGDPPSSSSKCSLLLEEKCSHWINVSVISLTYYCGGNEILRYIVY